VHLAAIGHPVIGDGTYGGIRHGIVSPRPFLHAAELAFIHPISNEPMSFTSPLPDDLAAVEAQFTT
jgi:23S rRNA pseudouridine1911/1915/1917 synthase